MRRCEDWLLVWENRVLVSLADQHPYRHFVQHLHLLPLEVVGEGGCEVRGVMESKKGSFG